MLRVAWLIVLATFSGACIAAVAAGDAGWREVVRTFALQHFKHPAWGYSHSVRDYQLAKALAEADHVTLDDDVLFAAAYLHDMAAFAPWDRDKEGIDHSDEGARVADQVLRDAGFPAAKIDSVKNAIRTHMYYRTPVGPEAIYLHDADALDWLGAIGVARVVALVDPNGGEPDAPRAVRMLEENLANVPSRVFSPAGRARVAKLSGELQEFLQNLGRETDGYRTL